VNLLVFRELGTASYVWNNTCKSENGYRLLKQDCCVEAVSPLKPSGHYMYRTAVTICTASLTFKNSTFCLHNVFMCFMWIAEQTAIISLYSIN